MKKEIVINRINELSLGNSNMNFVLRMAYLAGEKFIRSWPDEETERLGRKLMKAAGCLIHRRIDLMEMETLKGDYWQSKNGKRINLALGNYIAKKREVFNQSKSD